METTNKPNIALLQKGEAFKVIKITGVAGMALPEHHSTQEVLVTVQKGSASLTMNGNEHLLTAGEVIIIPASLKHDLVLKDEFEGLLIVSVA